MDTHEYTHTHAKPATLDLAPVQSILIESVLVPAITMHKLRFRYVPGPNLREEIAELFQKAVVASDVHLKLQTTTARAVRLLNFDYCYEHALSECLHQVLFEHFQQAIRTDPQLLEQQAYENQTRTHLLLVATRWYVDVMGDGKYVMDCLQEVQKVFNEAQAVYKASQTRH